jgi:hypothetical protein
VNILIYLADHLFRGCQSADNQFQALQNQEIEDFSIHGSRLPELEAEVVEIQLFKRISLRYLISVDQQDLVLGGFFCFSLLGHLQTHLYFPIVLDFRTFFFCGYYYSVYPYPSETLRESNFWFLLLLCFTLYPFVIQNGE